LKNQIISKCLVKEEIFIAIQCMYIYFDRMIDNLLVPFLGLRPHTSVQKFISAF